MSCPSPPPPYPLQPPPYTRRQRKPPAREPSPRPPRVSSRELLTEALKCAQRAVKLDLAKSDLPLTVAAYDEGIAILQLVIARRSQRPGITNEVERVTGIVSQNIPPSSLCHLEPSALTIVLAVSFFRLIFLSFFFFFVLLVFCSMTDTLIVYANCVAHTKFPCQVTSLPPPAGFPRR